ncbi:MAG: hypothetical protein HYR66_12850 [Sphingobacteriales bacterium]|nr:hypothetical protein [Sphingobacteriales bacterium]MBI3720458.1 hypothetical protein [Sphingobacteriales bacterium]
MRATKNEVKRNKVAEIILLLSLHLMITAITRHWLFGAIRLTKNGNINRITTEKNG